MTLLHYRCNRYYSFSRVYSRQVPLASSLVHLYPELATRTSSPMRTGRLSSAGSEMPCKRILQIA